MQKKKGFTITELLAVIVIMAIVALIGGSNVLSILNRSQREVAGEMRENLKEVALSYVLENVKIRPKAKCSVEFSKEMFEGTKEDSTKALLEISPEDEKCITRIDVKTLKEEGLFQDNQGHCKEDDNVVIYRYQDELGNNEYKAYASDTTCTN